MSRPFRLGTRRSALATAQSQQVADTLAAVAGRPVELVPIVSEGDVSRASLSQIGGTGVFATRLREALLAGECDLLVHSLKDLPTTQPPGLVIAAIPVREDARDVVVTRDGAPLHALPAGARVGTGSPRRRAQVIRRNPGVDVHDLRGNVDSRLQRVRDGQLDAVVLAAAGLSRIGLDLGDLGLEPLGLASWPTAPGQGALAIETLADGPADLMAALARIDHLDTRVAVTAERTVLAALEAGCHAPVGAHAELAGGSLRLNAVVYALDGSRRIACDRADPLPQEYGGTTGSGDGADAADDASPIAYAVRAGSETARRLLEGGAAGLVPRESTP
ncbi:hydroxymethylbilane synthase [Microbacterium sp. zg.Y1090]|uniref:hydroxymethylbilane synthase n=1 Tax=Microbacterium wangruii TaxID=3049073 RepID=UPI00214DC3B1|nr:MULTISPECIES: hydroxymethylbilane synthase [unclassified Microbacterium]MCR2819568.1 hydroxymethylbilane synthase [Microbacterium sp. zg.Y1090]MDL5487422.1 hydroxymethylbilane synthase [Microbacterium sp. zg-Y1211]WIM28535.1 hydroxymethylbilane synthase [Microbacterium sp. zg-Y1090]